MAKLTLSLGSNLGDRRALLSQARRELCRQLGSLVYRSPVISTPPWGPVAQQDYFNQVIVLSVDVPLSGPALPAALHHILEITQSIERQAGRLREVRWGPRTLDIDLIFLEDVIYEDARVSLPHPWWRHRSFVRDLLPSDLLDPHGRVLDAR